MVRSGRLVALASLLALLGLVPPALAASRRGGGSGAFEVRLGGFFPRASGDFWRANEELFAFDGSDLRSTTLGVTVRTAVARGLEVGFNLDFYSDTVATAYRDFVDDAGFPIVHDTRLRLMPLLVDLRVGAGGRNSRGKRGTGIYAGAGAGVTYWEYEEIGDFIDFGTDPLEIFFDRFRDDGWTFAWTALLGARVPLTYRTSVVIEGRYLGAEDDLGGDFAGFGTLDLSGASVQVGFAFGR